MRSYYVEDWMSTPPIVAPPTISLAEAQRVMEQHHIRRLPIVEDGQLVGIVTWGDLRAAQPSEATTLSVYEWRALLDKVTIAECMTTAPITIGPQVLALEAAQLMLKHKISGLPVVLDGLVIGMITESDLFRLLLAMATGSEQIDTRRVRLICHHCGTVLRGRSLDTIDAGDECWRCKYHLHRCDNCRYFDGIACMLNREDQHTGVPGQHCPAFAYLTERQAAPASGRSQPRTS